MIVPYLYAVVTGERTGFDGACLRAVLWVLSLFYRAGVLLARGCAWLRRQSLPAPLISVGNITVGGTGKTSLVQVIAEDLIAQGRKVVILTRGYRGSTRAQEHKSTSETMGDEAYMLQQNLPQARVCVDKDRARAARRAFAEARPDVFLLDDGFQQWHLRKDLEIVCIDATVPFGNGFLLPRGFLREPLSALRRASVVVVTKVDGAGDLFGLISFLRSRCPRGLIVRAVYEPVGVQRVGAEKKLQGITVLAGAPVALLCGIADPSSFERLLQRQGLSVGERFIFPDHHRFSARDLESALRRCREQGITKIVMTQKDAVRIRPQDLAARDPGVSLWFLRVQLKIIDNAEAFHSRIRALGVL